MKTNKIVEVFNDFSPVEFIDTVDACVNSFSFDTEGVAQELVTMNPEKQELLLSAVKSCIYKLSHTSQVDGRNEISAQTCNRLEVSDDPMPDAGERFMHMHPTLQQAAMKLFCCYIDKAKVPEYKRAIDDIKKEKGAEWYKFPLI